MVMTTGQGRPSTRRRLLTELRGLRKDKRLSVEDVASQVEWSPSKIVRIEGGQVGISVSDLNALLAVYEVHDRDRMEELRALARASRQKRWWSSYRSFISPGYVQFIAAEFDATRIVHYHPTTVPGLLQTPAYANAIIEGTALDESGREVTEARAEIRKLRQQYVLDRDDPPAITVIMDESVLRRPVGGAATMHEQLNHLIVMAARDNITMVVVPFKVGAHPGLIGAFALFGYGDPRVNDVLCVESPHNDLVLKDRPELTVQYRHAADHLEKVGLGKQDAVKFIEQARKDLR